MKSKLKIKNFRVFDEKGVIFEMNPITILTGSNSSGKSTVVKAVFLLNSFLSQIKKAIENGEPIDLSKYKLDFTTYPNNLLGRFDKVVHDGSESRSVTFEYSVYSLMLSKDVNVQLVFSSDENDELNNAYLDSITMSTDDGIFYFSGKNKNPYCNLNIIKEDYVTFLLTEYAVYSYCEAISKYYNEEVITQEEDKKYDKILIEATEYLKKVDKKRSDDIFRFVRTTKSNTGLIKKNDADPKVIEQLQGEKSIFSIPIIEMLSTLPKKEVEEFIVSKLTKDASEDVIFATHKVVNLFLESDFDNFYDFFADYEVRYFKKITCQTVKGVRLIKPYNLNLPQNYLTTNPYKVGREMRVLDDGIVVFKAPDTENPQKKAEIEKWKKRDLLFCDLYEVVMEWNKSYARDGKGVYTYVEPEKYTTWESFYHTSYKLLTMFTIELLNEVVCPDWCGNMSYVGSARANVSRIYSLDKKDDFSLLLQNYFEKKHLYLESAKSSYFIGKRDYVVNSFMNRWIEKFEIGKAISINIDDEGLGVQIRLHKNNNDKGRILADEGYGITQLVSILLQIETAILAANGEKAYPLTGLSDYDDYNEGTFHYEINTIAIEEPEIHLHPKYQSLLADMFLEAYEKYNIHFIIETHSEYLIRKAQVFVAKYKYENEEAMKKENPFKVYYVPRDEDPYEMEFCADGRFKNEFGKGFFDEATNLAFEIL